MDVSNVTWFVGNLALICTVASNFAGLQVCWKFIRSKSTENVSALPFIAGVACTSLWLQYGVYILDSVVITVNLIAVILQSSYTLCYYVYTNKKEIVHQQLLLVGTILISAFTYAWFLAENHQVATNLIGILACGGSIFACASPLASVRQVIKTRSTESLPFVIILASFIVTNLWCLYGLLINDSFIQFPNFVGALLSGFQLYLFWMFP